MPASSSAAPKPSYHFKRLRSTELMDLPGLDPSEREAALRGIEEISHWPGQRRPLLMALLRVIGPASGRLKLVELGAGSGHLSRWVALELARRGFEAEVLPTDLFPHPSVEKLDCLDPALPEADLYFSSLLLHHLDDASVSSMLALHASKARLGFAHFDLQRSLLHFYLAKARIALAGLPRINQIDALLSIQQGYSRRELRDLAGPGPKIRWSFPFRWMLEWRR